MLQLPLWLLVTSGCVLPTYTDPATDGETDTDTASALTETDSGIDTSVGPIDTEDTTTGDTDVSDLPTINACHAWDPVGSPAGWTRSYLLTDDSGTRTEVETGAGTSVSPYGATAYEIDIDITGNNRDIDGKRWVGCSITSTGYAEDLGWMQIENGGLGVGNVEVTFAPQTPRHYLQADFEMAFGSDSWSYSQNASVTSDAGGGLGNLYSGTEWRLVSASMINWGSQAPYQLGVWSFDEYVVKVTEDISTEPGTASGGSGGLSSIFQSLFTDMFASVFLSLLGETGEDGSTAAYRESYYVRGLGMVKQEVKNDNGDVLQTRILQNCTGLPHEACP